MRKNNYPYTTSRPSVAAHLISLGFQATEIENPISKGGKSWQFERNNAVVEAGAFYQRKLMELYASCEASKEAPEVNQ